MSDNQIITNKNLPFKASSTEIGTSEGKSIQLQHVALKHWNGTNLQDVNLITLIASIVTELEKKPNSNITGFSTDSKLDELKTLLTAINNKTIDTSNINGSVTVNTISGFATETTLANILAKIITSPATEAKQDTLISKIDALISQFSLASSGYTEANATLGTSSGTILLASSSRKGGFIQNLSDSDVFISEFIVPTITTGFVLAPYGSYTIRSTNIIRGITTASGKIVRVASW